MNLLSVDFSSTAAGYEWLKEIAEGDYKVIEAATLGAKSFWVLIESESDLLKISGSALSKKHFLGLKMIQDSKLPFREALSHLTPTTVQEALIILESETVSANLDVIDQLSTVADFQIMDIQTRGLSGMSLAYLTCKTEQTDAIFGKLQGLVDKLYNFEVLKEVPEKLEKFFSKN